MPVRLVDDDNDWSVDLNIDSAMLEALIIQAQRAEFPSGTRQSFPGKFECLMRQLLEQALDNDIKPPTDAQLKYALVIARTLGVALPGEALRYRGSMHAFIKRFDSSFRETKKWPERSVE